MGKKFQDSALSRLITIQLDHYCAAVR